MSESRRATFRGNRTGWAHLLLVLLLAAALASCSNHEQQVPSEPASSKPSSAPSGTVVARIESLDASEALRTYLDGWMHDFNVAAVGSETGTAPLDAAMAVPMDQWSTVTLSEFAIQKVDGSSGGPVTLRASFHFWRGNPASSARPAEPLKSSSTYRLLWDEQAGTWAITLTSTPPDSDLRPDVSE